MNQTETGAKAQQSQVSFSDVTGVVTLQESDLLQLKLPLRRQAFIHSDVQSKRSQKKKIPQFSYSTNSYQNKFRSGLNCEVSP